MRAILDHGDAALGGERVDLVEIARRAAVVHDHDAPVRSVSRSAIDAGSIEPVSGCTSANTGVSDSSRIAWFADTNVSGEVTTSAPGARSSTRSASRSAVVQELSATQ